MTKLAEHSQTWISMDEACSYTGRSLATLKNWVNAGKIGKRLMPLPGARPRVQVLREDLAKVMDSPVHVAVEVAEHSQTKELAKASQSEPMPQAHVALNGLAPVLARLAEIFPSPPAVQLHAKLTWSLREAREMTGLSEPALREMIERKPDLAIRYGRRLRIKAEGLRRELA